MFTFRLLHRDATPCSKQLPDVAAARDEALRLIAELMWDTAQTQAAGDHWRFEVLNEAGLRVVEVNVDIEMTMPAKHGTPPA